MSVPKRTALQSWLARGKGVPCVQGLHGRLGDLGSIDAQYDAAASNASGALDNFVVDTTEDAQAAVRYLRENGLGLATFIILDKQRDHERQANEQVITPEGAPRLVDLVKCSNEMRVAFFFAFRNTIVAKDIDQASRLGLRGKDRRFARVVTLQVLPQATRCVQGGLARCSAVYTLLYRIVMHTQLVHFLD